MGLNWRTRRIFQFPNGANRAQIAGLASEYLRHLVDTSWEQGRNDATLMDLCDSLKQLSASTDARFRTYPFRSPKKIAQLSVELPRDSAIGIFRYLLSFLASYPNVRGFLNPKDLERFKGRQLIPERETQIITKVKEMLASF